jgi:hypothetical protein
MDTPDADTLNLLRLAARVCFFLALAVAGAGVSWFVESMEHEREADRCA